MANASDSGITRGFLATCYVSAIVLFFLVVYDMECARIQLQAELMKARQEAAEWQVAAETWERNARACNGYLEDAEKKLKEIDGALR